jgi:hypothetical protein
MTRAVVTGIGSVLWSNMILGNPINQSTFISASLMSGSCVAAESMTRFVLPLAHLSSSKSGINIGVEAALASGIYAMAYPRVFTGTTVPFMTLAQNCAIIDVSSQLVSERVHDMLTGDDAY